MWFRRFKLYVAATSTQTGLTVSDTKKKLIKESRFIASEEVISLVSNFVIVAESLTK